MPSVIKTIRLPPAALAGGLELRNKLVGTNQQDVRCKSIELALADISTSETANVRRKTDAEGCTGASRALLHSLSCLSNFKEGQKNKILHVGELPMLLDHMCAPLEHAHSRHLETQQMAEKPWCRKEVLT
jgi:Lon protease-like protein